MCVAGSQMGEPPAQLESVRQPTQVPVVGSHMAIGPMHCIVSVAEHCVHSPWSGPLVWHTGVGTAQSESLPQGPHVCVATLQTGVVPPQLALLVHCTQTSVVPLSKQTRPAGLPVQSALLAHCAHCPTCALPIGSQTGWSGAVHSELIAHARQVSVAGPPDLSQMGVAVFGLASQLAFDAQATH